MKRSFVALIFSVACAARAEAQTDRPALSLTLDEAIARGLGASHRVAEVTARREGAEAVVEQRNADKWPQVALSAGYTRTNHVDPFGVQMPNGQVNLIYPDLPDNVRSRIDGQWNIYNGGRLAALQEAARLEGLAVDRDLGSLRQDLALEITRVYWTLVVARESLTLVNDSLARLGAHLRDVRNQLDAGLVPPNDVFTAEAREARERMLSVRAASVRDNAESELARLIGIDQPQRIEPISMLTFPVVDEQVEALLARARTERADRQALELRIQSTSSREKAAAAGLHPSIGVGAGFDLANPNPKIFPRKDEWARTWDAGVNMTWQVFDGGRTRGATAEAAAARRALEARVRELDSVMSLEVRQRLSEIEAARAAIEAADAGVRAANEALRVVGERFAAGVATSTEVLDAQGDVLQAEFDRTDALASASFAEARLRRTLGR